MRTKGKAHGKACNHDSDGNDLGRSINLELGKFHGRQHGHAADAGHVDRSDDQFSS
jgi:hypothetical protein